MNIYQSNNFYLTIVIHTVTSGPQFYYKLSRWLFLPSPEQ